MQSYPTPTTVGSPNIKGNCRYDDSNYNHRMTSYTALYNVEKRDDGWAVIDVRTGVAAVENGVELIGMSLGEADDLADLLTSREWKTETAQ